jgi:hypothetical protein
MYRALPGALPMADQAGSMEQLPGKSIASTPELAHRAPLAVVINALLVRAANDAVGHGNRARTVLLDEFEDLPGNGDVFPNIAGKRMPGAHLSGLFIFRWYDPDGDLGCLTEVRTVERDRRKRPAPLPPPSFLAQALQKSSQKYLKFSDQAIWLSLSVG